MGEAALLLTARRGLSKAQTWVIDTRPLVIGRSEACDIVIPDATVSRRHCEITRSNGGVLVRDLRSSNRLLINGMLVSEGSLRIGDELGIGSAVFLLTTTEPGAVPVGKSPQGCPAAETIALPESDIALLRAPDDPDAVPASPADYVFLFHLGRALSQCLTAPALAEKAIQLIRKQFNPGAIWLLRCAGDGFEAVGSSTPVDARLPSPDELEALLGRRQSMLLPQAPQAATGPVPMATLMVAPLHIAQCPWGVLCVWTESPQPLYESEDLHLFGAAASVLAPHVRAMEETERLRRHNDRMLALSSGSSRIVGRSAVVHKLRESVRSAAVTDLPVLILGETGSGKELVAEAIHEQSGRAGQPYVVVNCAAIPTDLFESEFFGHAAGAYTGSTGERMGLAEAAHRGTLFLDEIGDLSPANQARLLRFIELGTFRRLGSNEERRVDVRAVAATNRDLWQPGFRSDLLYRLDGFTIQVPPLRNRLEDIAPLAQHFLELMPPAERGVVAGFTGEALEYLQSLPWPGNVRELMKAVRRSAGLASGTLVTLADVASAMPNGSDTIIPSKDDLTLAEVERIYLERVIERCDGNLTQAARILGVSRTTLYNKRTAWKRGVEG